MSNDAAPVLHLRGWIAALFAALKAAEPQRAEAIRRLAAADCARIGLDSQRVRVDFHNGRLRLIRLRDDAPCRPPFGITDSATVAAILSGWMELGEAVRLDRIALQGSADAVMRICAIVEILVDSSTRIPAMQALSRSFLAQRPATGSRGDHAFRHAAAARTAGRERELLLRAGLLG